MKELLKALRGVRIVEGVVNGRKVTHYWLPNGQVIEIVG